MDLNDILRKGGFDPETCLVLRHRPPQREFNRLLPRLVVEKPEVFNCYQQTQSPNCEKQMMKATHVVALIGHEPGKAVYAGLYEVASYYDIPAKEFLQMPVVQEERRLRGLEDEKFKPRSVTWFDLRLLDFHREWQGKLVVGWVSELSWSRWAAKNTFPVQSIRDESLFSERIPDWREIVLSWNELQLLSSSWREALRQWRGIYFILDSHSKQGYVGAAYGAENILGRWLTYAKTGHGGNRWLMDCKPENLRFSILERLSPDMSPEEVIEREVSWKKRLHTREFGLNGN